MRVHNLLQYQALLLRKVRPTHAWSPSNPHGNLSGRVLRSLALNAAINPSGEQIAKLTRTTAVAIARATRWPTQLCWPYLQAAQGAGQGGTALTAASVETPRLPSDEKNVCRRWLLEPRPAAAGQHLAGGSPAAWRVRAAHPKGCWYSARLAALVVSSQRSGLNTVSSPFTCSPRAGFARVRGTAAGRFWQPGGRQQARCCSNRV